MTLPSPPPPWTRVRQGEPLDFHVLKVREDTVAHPRDGSHHARVLLDTPDWVNVVAYTPEGQVVLIRQFRTGVWDNTLEVPGGMVDPGESPREAAARELEEETGYVPGRMVELGWVHPNPALQNNRCYSFLALDCVLQKAVQLDAGEDISVELHPGERIPELLRSGAITHALVVGAFFLEHLARAQGLAGR